jgi:hypothetical protein
VLGVASKRKVKIPPEALAWGNLAATVLALYTPRVIAFLARDKTAEAAPAPGDVKPITVLRLRAVPPRVTGLN